MFIMPTEIYKKLDQLMVRFLGASAFLDSHKSHVAWNEVTQSKCEGGLGIRKLSKWNKATTLKHPWHILMDERGNVWAKWVQSFSFGVEICGLSILRSSALGCGEKSYLLGILYATLLHGVWVMDVGFFFFEELLAPMWPYYLTCKWWFHS